MKSVVNLAFVIAVALSALHARVGLTQEVNKAQQLRVEPLRRIVALKGHLSDIEGEELEKRLEDFEKRGTLYVRRRQTRYDVRRDYSNVVGFVGMQDLLLLIEYHGVSRYAVALFSSSKDRTNDLKGISVVRKLFEPFGMQDEPENPSYSP